MNDRRTWMPFQMMALAVPAVETAAGRNWLPTLMISMAAFLLCTVASFLEEPEWKWLYSLRCIVIACLLGWVLDWTHSCWPGEQASWVVPALLLLFAMYGVWKGSGRNACSVLRSGMYLILAAVGILGLGNLRSEMLRPMMELPNWRLAGILFLQLILKKSGKWGCSAIGLFAVAASLVVTENISLFEYSRGLALHGVTEHLESVVACAVTVGYFGLLSLLLYGIKEDRKRNWEIWAVGLAGFGIYAMGVVIHPVWYVIALLLLWVAAPLIWTLKSKIMLDK